MELKGEKEREKASLNEETVTVRRQIEEQKSVLEERRAAIKAADAETQKEQAQVHNV
jgi:hypothetical protein